PQYQTASPPTIVPMTNRNISDLLLPRDVYGSGEQDECHGSRSLTRWKCHSQRELHERPDRRTARSYQVSLTVPAASPGCSQSDSETRTETIDAQGAGSGAACVTTTSSITSRSPRSPRREAAWARGVPRRVEESEMEDLAGKSYRPRSG